MTLENLRDAKESLEQAEEHAGLGTGFMVTELREQLENLIERTENIHDSQDE